LCSPLRTGGSPHSQFNGTGCQASLLIRRSLIEPIHELRKQNNTECYIYGCLTSPVNPTSRGNPGTMA
jgi:hypothetical protein